MLPCGPVGPCGPCGPVSPIPPWGPWSPGSAASPVGPWNPWAPFKLVVGPTQSAVALANWTPPVEPKFLMSIGLLTLITPPNGFNSITVETPDAENVSVAPDPTLASVVWFEASIK